MALLRISIGLVPFSWSVHWACNVYHWYFMNINNEFNITIWLLAGVALIFMASRLISSIHVSTLKLKAGMHIPQLRRLLRKGKSIIMILYLIDGLYSISFPFCLGIFMSVQLGIRRLSIGFRIQWTKVQRSLYSFSSWLNDIILMNWFPVGLIFVASETQISNIIKFLNSLAWSGWLLCPA